MKYNNLHSEIYSDLKQRAWDKTWGRLIIIGIVTLVVIVPVLLIIYNAYYPIALIHSNHHEMFLAEINSHYK